MNFEITSFDNGLQLVTVPMPHSYSVSMGIYITVGSRFERPEQSGAAHFIEHMLFKGTTRRPTARDIALSVEAVGGDINASTGREWTTYYTRVSRDHLHIGIDVLLDMLRHSRFDEPDVDRERQVITEEIAQAPDVPEDLVFLQFQELLWPDHPLGQDIAGTRNSVAHLDRDHLLDFMGKSYVPSRTVIAAAGAVDHGELSALLAPVVGSWPAGDGPAFEPVAPRPDAAIRVKHRPSEQTHLLLGVRTGGRNSEDRYALALLNSLLGDGMSSRLFTRIREDLGLAYSTYSFISNYAEAGQLGIYAAIDPRRTEEALDALLGELRRLRDEPVAEEELAFCKAYAHGRTLLRLEDTGANAGWVGTQLALNGEVKTPEEQLAALHAVSIEEVQRVAQRYITDDALTLSVVGPLDEAQCLAAHLAVE